MDGIGEVVVRVGGVVLRIIAEALLEIFLSPVVRFVGWIYDGVFQRVRWILRSDFIAVPVTLLLLLGLGAGNFAAVVKIIQMMIA